MLVHWMLHKKTLCFLLDILDLFPHSDLVSAHTTSGTWKMVIQTVSNSISGILYLFCAKTKQTKQNEAKKNRKLKFQMD